MKRQIRRNVFETNSSSTHAICITKEDVNKSSLPSHVTFVYGEFGWEFDEYYDTWTKASYLYEAIHGCYDGDERKEKLNSIEELLSEYNISCDFEPSKDKEYGDGYIDHVYETTELVEYVLSDGDNLIKYLFGDSFIITGNDNSESFKERMCINKGIITTNYGSYTNYGGFKPEFDNYKVIEKGN